MHSNGPAKILVLVIASILLGCGSPPRAKIPDRPGRVDAPIVLASDDDLGEVRAAYDALALDAPGRDTRRNELASEYSRRIESTLRRGKRTRAFLHFESLLQLWRPMELQQAHETTEFVALVPIAELLRKTFAKSGGDLEASAALYAMALMQPGKASKHYSDIEEIFQYGDELAVLEHGPGARRSRPISILESTVRFLPSASVVSRLVALYTERQEAIKSSFRRKGADMQLLRIHGPGVLTTAQNIVRILAESGRIRDARNAIASISGIGDDARLRKRLVAASTSSGPTPWLLLSANFLDVEGDEGAALAICREAIRLYPKAAMSYVCAGESAEKLGNILLAIRYYELALKFGPEQRKTNEALATLYEQRVSTLAYSDRPNAALAQLKTFEALHKSAAKRFETPLLPDLASAYTAMARGLVSLGELAEAHLYLARSIRLRPSLSAFEELGTIALRQEQFVEARSHFEKALALPTEQLEELFHRAAIRRISAEALAGNGDEEGAREQRELAFATWLELLNKYELSTAGESEARIEIGKLM
ncbi:MAG: hypothetical protein GY811_19785, partial [Myxococcales bacterium]|nr:hypothetical protein [Myxococcales bacterium]